jgi:hypothetical protein
VAISGRTVGDFLSGPNGIMEALSKKNEDIKDKGYTQQATKYSVVFLDKNGKPDPNGPIASAIFPNNYEVNLELAPMSPAAKTSDVTVKNSVNAKTADTTKQTVTVKAGASIINLIDKIINESSYVTKSLNRSTDQDTETSSKSNPGKETYKSFTVNPVFKGKGIDQLQNLEWGEIVYEIMPKEITWPRSQYVEKKTPYRGPFKYYEYMFTGKNTEILKYEQAFNAQYFVTSAVTDSNNSPYGSRVAEEYRKNPNSGVPTIARTTSAGDTTSVRNNQGAMIAQDVRTNLYSLKDQATAKIKILGDPDYFMSAIGVSQQSVESSSSRYIRSDGSINPFGSQVLIEIRFNSPYDYTDKGLLDVRNNIQFYESQSYAALKAAKIDGIVYQVHTVESNMSKGVFTQTLDMFIVPDDQLLGNSTSTVTEGRQGTSILPGSSTVGTVATSGDIRSPRYATDEEADLANEQSNYTISDDYFGGIASTPPPPQSPNDDQNLPPSPRTIPEVSSRIEELNRQSTGIEGITQIVAP